ncbi:MULTISPECIES: trypsin-like serine protease [Streptomyces]|uniref:trypsin-like serine protease n=1 Tax=Streptomyces TaxID=1883 RepID=UPI0016783978|nr:MULTISPECIES: trypsin-like serine protease [Streptomyces]MBK3525817.1 S1 family peptidase [Streptomyces sp. MBT70]GGS01713.1 esterase [Streptomyces eurythermus]
MRLTRHVRLTALAAALLAGPVAVCAAPVSAVTGTPVGDAGFGFTAQIVVGDHDRGCSGVLVDPEWLLTAASCFVADPAAGLTVPAGKPRSGATATIGRLDLGGSDGAVRGIVQLVPRTDRDVVLARLNRPVPNVAPVALSATAPAAGEELKFAGFGRNKAEWAPLKLHTGALTVDSAATTTATVTGKDGAAACMGDTGGPVVRAVGGTPQLVALNSQSYQGGCYGMDPAETRTGGIAARVDGLGSWVNSTVGAPGVADFNCDGVEDTAITDPKATVGGDDGAGVVRVVYGGGKGTAEINQDLDWVDDAAEPGDWFGESLATVDYDEDGCTDLVVGSPSEDLDKATDAGTADLLYGAPGGLGTGATKSTHFQQGTGTGSLKGSGPETGDRLGQALAAGTTAAGEPYLVIGAPGESIGTVAKAGMAFYVHGDTNTGISQDSTGVPGAVEANDGFGAVIAADANHLAIGAPTETIGADADAGNFAVFSHKLNSAQQPTPLFGLDQDLDTVGGSAEPGDLFAKSLAMVDYRPSGAAAATDSILAVGAPGEDLDIDGVSKADTGQVFTFRITAAGTYSQLNTYYSGTASDEMTGTSEAGDHFGQTVAAVNTAPRAVGSTATMKLAVGIPDEAVGSTAGAGAITTFSLLGARGDNNRWIEAGTSGIPGPPGANQHLGVSLHYTGTKLYVGMPYGPSGYGTVHGVPLSNVTGGGTNAAITTYQPGKGGLPAAGARFGYVVR